MSLHPGIFSMMERVWFPLRTMRKGPELTGTFFHLLVVLPVILPVSPVGCCQGMPLTGCEEDAGIRTCS